MYIHVHLLAGTNIKQLRYLYSQLPPTAKLIQHSLAGSETNARCAHVQLHQRCAPLRTPQSVPFLDSRSFHSPPPMYFLPKITFFLFHLLLLFQFLYFEFCFYFFFLEFYFKNLFVHVHKFCGQVWFFKFCKKDWPPNFVPNFSG